MKYIFALKLRKLVNSLIPVLLPPGELMRYNAEIYRNWAPNFSNRAYLAAGLNDWEEMLVKKYLTPPGKVLDLMCGAGREAFALQKLGFEVYGVDSNEFMLKNASAYAQELNLPVQFYQQDMLNLSFSEHKFNYALLFTHNYSSIAGKTNRIKFLKELKELLKAEGKFLATFKYKPAKASPKFRLKKLLAYLCCGNFALEPGDLIHCDMEFAHYFYNIAEIEAEAQSAELKIEAYNLEPEAQRGYVVFKT
jgi:ubiquinone/menaquinone biosynthesis C-methylase UbiE